MNHVTLVGRLGHDPVIEDQYDALPSVTTVTICTPMFHRKGRKRVSKPIWHNLTFFGRPGEAFYSNAREGDQVAVSGRLDYRDMDHKRVAHVVVDQFDILVESGDEDPVIEVELEEDDEQQQG